MRTLRIAGVVALILATGVGPSDRVAAQPAAADPVADDPFPECGPLVTEGEGRWKSYRCRYAAARQSDRVADVAAWLDTILERTPDDGAALSVRASCAAMLSEDGRFELLRRAAALLEAEGDLANAAYSLMQLSNLEHGSDPDATRRDLERALRLAERSEDEEAILWSKLEQARFLYYSGENLDEATRVVVELGDVMGADQSYGTRINYLGLKVDLLGDLGQDERALEVQQQMLRLHREQHDSYGQSRMLGQLVVALWDDPERAQEILGMSLPHALTWVLEMARRSGNRFSELNAQLWLGEMRMGSEEERFARCRVLARQVKSLYYHSRCLVARALFRLDHDPDAAFEDIEEAAQMVEGLGLEQMWVSLNRMTMVWRSQPDRALGVSLAHLDDLEDLFRRHRTSLTRAYVRANYMTHYLDVADQVLERSPSGPSREDIDVALRIVERMRAQELLAALEARPGMVPEDDPRRLAHAAANEEISGIQRQLLEDEPEEDERAQLMDRLARAEKEEQAAWAEVLRTDPVVAGIERTTPPALDELQQTLRDDEAILSYQLEGALPLPEPGSQRSTPRVIVVTRRSVRAIDLAAGRDLEALIDLFGGLFESRGGHERSPAAGLYQRVLAEALEGLPPGIEHLVLVPDGPLHRLPFAALRATPQAAPLVERYRLSQVPSLAVWLRLRRSAPRDGKVGALVLADPEIAGQAGVIAGERAWAIEDGLGFGRLPHAREEGEALIRHVGEGSELRVGEAATEAGLKAGDVEHFSILHFASHAVLDDEHPERSAVLLAPGNEREDGLLQTREIARLDLHGAMVVLASCRSGSGTVVGGEGPVGLSRAFFEAGSRTVVASLWRLRDDDAAAIFDAFYRHLRLGESVSSALAAAQNERRRAGAPAAAWAGIVVLGDGAFVPFPRRASASTVGWWALASVLGLAFVFGGIAGLRSRRTRSARA